RTSTRRPHRPGRRSWGSERLRRARPRRGLRARRGCRGAGLALLGMGRPRRRRAHHRRRADLGRLRLHGDRQGVRRRSQLLTAGVRGARRPRRVGERPPGRRRGPATTGRGGVTVEIMIDVDDVIMPWFDTVDRLCAETWGYDGSRGVCDNWHMWEFYGRSHDDWADVVITATANGLYTNTPPFPGAVEAINHLRWEGHRVHIVTARGFMANGENIRRWTHDYLAEFAIGHDTLTFAKDKVDAMT